MAQNKHIIYKYKHINNMYMHNYKCSKAHSVKGEQICCGMGVKMGAARFYTHSAADLQGVGESLFN